MALYFPADGRHALYESSTVTASRCTIPQDADHATLHCIERRPVCWNGTEDVYPLPGSKEKI